MADRVLQRRDTAANWAAANPILAEGELGIVTDTKGYKIGDGVTHWNDLAYPSNPTQVVDNVGTSTTAAISQRAVTEMVGLDEYPIFSESTAYSAGDVVNYNGKLYKFTEDHAAGAWTGSDVEETNLLEIAELNGVNFTNNAKVNNFLKELYTNKDVSGVTYIRLWKAAPYNDSYVTGIQFYGADGKIVDGGNIAYSYTTKEAALTAATSIIRRYEWYCVVDWSKISNGTCKDIICSLSPICNNIKYSPTIEQYRSIPALEDSINKLESVPNDIAVSEILVGKDTTHLGVFLKKGTLYIVHEESAIDINHSFYIFGDNTTVLASLKGGTSVYVYAHMDGEAAIYNTETLENPEATITIQKVNTPAVFTNNNAVNFLIKELYFDGDLSTANKIIFYKGSAFNDRYLAGVQIYQDSQIIANIVINVATLTQALAICNGGIINYNGGYIIVNWKFLKQGTTTFIIDNGVFNNNVLDYSPSIKTLLLDNDISKKYTDVVPVVKGETVVVSSFTSAHTRLGIHLKKGITYKIHEDSNINNSHSFYIYGTTVNSLSLKNGVTGYFTPHIDGEAALYYTGYDKSESATIMVEPLTRVINETDFSLNASFSLSGRNGIGFAQKNNIDDCDYCYLPVYGQSFTGANDGQYRLTEIFDEDCYMVGDSSYSWNNSTLNALSTKNNQEFIHTDAISLISKLYKKYAHKAQKFIVGSYGRGNKTILELMKNNGIDGEHAFEEQFLPGLQMAKEAMQNTESTFNCPCILYMQGESDYSSGYVNGCKGDKELYKSRFLTLKNDMQQAVMEITGQTEPPSIMVYVVGGRAFNNLTESIAQAVNELAEENTDVISIGPYYQVPDFTYHPTPDGRRWLGEIIAKVYYENFIIGINNTLSIKSATLRGDKIYISIKNAVLPLQVDTNVVEAKEHYGFRVAQSSYETVNTYTEEISNAPLLTQYDTSIYVEAGKSYRVKLDNGAGSANVFVKGHIDYFVSRSVGSDYILFIPQYDGAITLYPTGDSALSATLTVLEISVEVDIKDITFRGNTIIIHLSNVWRNSFGHCILTYGNSLDKGEGNIKDSEEWISYYLYESNSQGESDNALTYEPKWKDGTSMIGHNYDMCKWLPNFGLTL